MRDVDQNCLTRYLRRHHGWLARLERGAHCTELAPLVGLELGAAELIITLGEERYHLPDPRRVIELQDEEGDHGLWIVLADRAVILRFRVPMHPEMLG